MSNSDFKKGVSDAQKNIGPPADSSFKTSQAKEQYYAGRGSVKK
ncbi:MAG: hypothetical protein AAGI37_09160 [Planctomycetota bacterium]